MSNDPHIKITIAIKPADHCTCHPSDNPPRPCPQRYAYSECVAVAAILPVPGLHPHEPTRWRDGFHTDVNQG